MSRFCIGYFLPWITLVLLTAVDGANTTALGASLPQSIYARVASGQPTKVIVEFDGTAVDRSAQSERVRRGLLWDDAAVKAARSRGYLAVKSAVESAVGGADASKVLDYSHFPLAVWRISSVAALQRLQRHPSVVSIHENALLRPVSVSDLAFINQPQTAAEGASGAGTTIAVIDGGLGSNYLNYSDFGTCTAVNTPASSCRVAYNQDFYPGASTETVHGTNVSAISLGVAPGAKLAMFDVFNGSSASSADVLTAMDTAISQQTTYDIVAINLSLGDGSSNSTQCTQSVFATAVANASNAGIITVAAAGNSGSKSGLSNPACVPGVVSVGAVYDSSYGNLTWQAPADSGGQCTDASAADKVTCFSQSASYLSILAPGTFVNAPNSSFQQSGTSQATPHISGSVAVARARYPREPLAETVQRLQITGIRDTDTGNGLTAARLNLLAAINQGTSLTLAGTGPATATSGATSVYILTATNGGPLLATNVSVTDALPPGAEFVSASPGCAFASGVVTCSAVSLGVGANITFTLTVRWDVSGPVFDSAAVTTDQINSAPSGQTMVAFGNASSESGDAPLPLWSYALLALGLLVLAVRPGHPHLKSADVEGTR